MSVRLVNCAVHALHHENTFRDAVKKIEKAVQRALVSDKKYTRVGVISLRWENDDLNLGAIETELLEAFRNIFQFETESFLIPANTTHGAARAAREKLRDFVYKYDGPTSLLIVIYHGHSDFQTQAAGQELCVL